MFQNKLKFAALLVAGSAVICGQTQVDLRTQAKSVDFTAAPATRPVKTGTALPATCTVGDLFFMTTAAPGANVFGCVAANTWSLQSGAGGGGSLTIDSNSTLVGTRGVNNFIAGTGIQNLISDTGTEIDIQQNADPSYMLTRAQGQAGSDLTLSCTSGNSTVYGCSPNGNVLGAYTDQQRFGWKPDVSCGAAPTINLSTLGAKQLYRSDGTAIQAGDCTAGAQVSIWYDATANGGAGGFKLTQPSGTNAGQIAGVLGGANGGTGVNNGSSTLTLGGSLTTAGAFSSTFTMTGATSVTFPASGTLMNTGTSVALGQTPLTAQGDMLYVNTTPALARLAGNTTTTLNVLTQTGTGSASAAPAWQTARGGGDCAVYVQRGYVFSDAGVYVRLRVDDV